MVGALAAAVHGDVRGTADANALLFVALEQLKPLCADFERAGLQTEIRLGGHEDPIPAMLIAKDFIAMKCYAGCPQDIADARAALDRRDVTTDLDLLRRLTRRFGRAAADLLEHLLPP